MGAERVPGRAGKLRVLHAVDNWLPTTENWCYRLIAGVPDVEVHVLANEFIPGSPWRKDFFAHPMPMTQIRSRKTLLAPRIWNRVSYLTRNLQRWLLARSLKGSVDLLHAHFAPVGWKCIPLARNLGVPLVVSYYGFDYDKLPYDHPHWNSRYLELFSAATAIFCEGASGVRQLVSRGCDPAKLHVSRLGVDVHDIVFQSNHRRGDKLRVLQLARLMEKKGHADAIRAVALASKSIDIEFEIVGSESDVRREDLRKLAVSLGVDDKITFVDQIDYSSLHTYLADFDVFLHPSRTAKDRDCEGGAPVVFLDAQAVGLPVISTYHCDIPDEVVDGSTGILSPEGAVSDLAESLCEFSRMDDDKYEQFRLAGRRHVEAFFDSGKNSINRKSLYSDIVSLANG